MTALLDLDDTHRCPLAPACATCAASDGLAVGVADTPVGAMCLTLCEGCADAGALPRLTWPDAARLVGHHCEHLGVDLDQAAAARTGGGST